MEQEETKEPNGEYFYAFSLRLATYLSDKGFEVLRTEISFKKPKFKIFVFKMSDELKKALDEFKSVPKTH